jgi:hypothetical protein
MTSSPNAVADWLARGPAGVRISAWSSATLTEGFWGYPPSLSPC